MFSTEELKEFLAKAGIPLRPCWTRSASADRFVVQSMWPARTQYGCSGNFDPTLPTTDMLHPERRKLVGQSVFSSREASSSAIDRSSVRCQRSLQIVSF